MKTIKAGHGRNTLIEAGVAAMSVRVFLLEHVLPDKGGLDAAAHEAGISPEVFSGILDGRQKLTDSLAGKLASLYPGSSPEFWLNLQANSDHTTDADPVVGWIRGGECEAT